jgi:hypothetical protein
MKQNQCVAVFKCERQDDCRFFLRDAQAPTPVCKHCSSEGKCESEEAIRNRVELLMRRYGNEWGN